MAKLDPNKIKYLAFEGGGGKGMVYLGVVEALETKYEGFNSQAIEQTKNTFPANGGQSPPQFSIMEPDPYYSTPKPPFKPLFPIWESHPYYRPLRGVSGSSAGAMTAFFLAMGVSAHDLREELNMVEQGTMFKNLPIKVSTFETFLENPEPGKFRCFREDSNVQTNKPDSDFIKKYEKFRNIYFSASSIPLKLFGNTAFEDTLLSMLNSDFLIRKILFSDFEWKGTSDFSKVKLWNSKEDFGDVEYERLQKLLKSNLSLRERNSLGFRYPKYRGLEGYIYSMIVDRGIFSGLQIRKYLARMMDKYLFERAYYHGVSHLLPLDANGKYIGSENVTFSNFFNITGVDLVLTGTNITQNVPLVFSVSQSPDFPVIDAVGLSMSIPFLFKPFIIADRVNRKYGNDEYENLKYYGMIVDGGMLNNYPIYAFNKVSNITLQYHNLSQHIPIAEELSTETFIPHTLGFRLQSNLLEGVEGIQAEIDRSTLLPYRNENQVKAILGKSPKAEGYLSFFGELYETISYYSEMGQVASKAVAQNTILIDTGDISVADFAPGKLDFERGFEKRAERKSKLVEKARETIKRSLTS